MAEVQVPETAYDAADRYLAAKEEGEDSLGAVDAAAPFIAAAAAHAARIELCTDLIAQFETDLAERRTSNPGADGLLHCIEHLRSRLSLLNTTDTD